MGTPRGDAGFDVVARAMERALVIGCLAEIWIKRWPKARDWKCLTPLGQKLRETGMSCKLDSPTLRAFRRHAFHHRRRKAVRGPGSLETLRSPSLSPRPHSGGHSLTRDT